MFHVSLHPEEAKPETQLPQVAGATPYTEILYQNKTSQAVYIKDRFGAMQTILPLPAEAKLDGKFHVVVSWHTTLYSPFSLTHSEVQLQKITGTPHVCRRAAVRYTLSPSEYNGDDPIFSRDLGLLISFKRPFNITDVFPDTPGTVTKNNPCLTAKLDREDEVNINIVIVDNINPDAPYYLNIENRVYKIYSKLSKDSGNMPDGVHITDTCRPVDGNSETFYSLKECIYQGDGKYESPITLFTNPHDAKTNGHRNALLEANAHKMKLELKEREREILDLKNLMAKAKEESLLRKASLETTSDYRKDFYEGKSYNRKDISEGFSMPAKIITGICALATAAFGIGKLLL